MKVSNRVNMHLKPLIRIVIIEQTLKIVSGYTILLILALTKLMGMKKNINESVSKLMTVGSVSNASDTSITTVDSEFMNIQLATILQKRQANTSQR